MVAEALDIKIEDIWAKGRYRNTVEARSLFCYLAVRELGETMSSLAEMFGISIPSISASVKRGQMIAYEKGFDLLKDL
jgi:chromosomal replication initiation ATPase DnaA